MTITDQITKERADLMIHSLEVNNYRQYFGQIKIEFSKDPKKPFTVVQGANGAGKSNIMNAISWCLYLKEPHLKKESEGLPIINTRALTETPIGKVIEMSVTIVIGNSKEALYSISRKLRAYKNYDITNVENTAFGPLPAGVTPTLYERFMINDPAKGWQQTEQFETAANHLIPYQLSSFFFFDGEELTRFFSESLANVRKGIEVISQITLTDSAIERLHQMALNYRKETKGYSSEADKILQEIKQIEEFRDIQKKKYQEKTTEIEPLEKRIKEIEAELRKNPIEVVRHHQKRRDELRGMIREEYKELDDIKNKRLSIIFSLGPKVYLENCISDTLKEINTKVEQKILPPPIDRIFCNELLESGECICGRDIPKSGPVRSKIEQLLGKVELSQVYTLVAQGKFILQNMLDGFESNLKQLDEHRTKMKMIEKSIQKKQEELNEISIKLQNIGDEEKITQLENELTAKTDWVKDLRKEIAVLDSDIKRAVGEIERLNTLHDKEVSKDTRLKIYQQRIGLCEMAEKVLSHLREELLSEVRKKVEAKTKEYFLELIWKKKTFTDVKIDENYKIAVIHRDGYNAIGSLSAGETLYLALSFIAALRDITGFKFPLVIDTPLGRVSGQPKINAAENLPRYLPGTQITLLVTDTEYVSPVLDSDSENPIGSFREKILSSVGKEYKLSLSAAEDQTMVIPYDS
jgi:DNA sulfur modification protein DndD